VSLAGTIGEHMRDPLFAGLWFGGRDLCDQLNAVGIAERFVKNQEDRRQELQRARNFAALILSAHWPAVKAVAETLIRISEHGTSLDGTTVRQLIASFTPNEDPRGDLEELGRYPGAAKGLPPESESLRWRRRSREWN